MDPADFKQSGSLAYCTSDHSVIRFTRDAQRAYCDAGRHRWVYVAPDPNVPNSRPGWRQIDGIPA